MSSTLKSVLYRILGSIVYEIRARRKVLMFYYLCIYACDKLVGEHIVWYHGIGEWVLSLTLYTHVPCYVEGMTMIKDRFYSIVGGPTSRKHTL